MLPRSRVISIVAPTIASDLRAAPRAARVLGFGGLQVPLVWGGNDLSQFSGTARREVRNLLSGSEQQFVALSVDIGNKGLSPGADLDRVISRLDLAMQAARELSAGVISVDLGPLPQPARDVKPAPTISAELAGLILLPAAADFAPPPAETGPPATTDASFFSQVDAALLEIGQRADRYSVVLALRSDLSSLAALERAIRAADCPWFGVEMDAVALLRDEWSADEAFSRLGNLIRHVRARDAVGGAGGRTRPAAIGAGEVEWAEFVARVDEAGYQGWITLDPSELPDRVAAASEGLNLLRQVVRR